MGRPHPNLSPVTLNTLQSLKVLGRDFKTGVHAEISNSTEKRRPSQRTKGLDWNCSYKYSIRHGFCRFGPLLGCQGRGFQRLNRDPCQIARANKQIRIELSLHVFSPELS